jgi:hypothetical protein
VVPRLEKYIHKAIESSFEEFAKTVKLGEQSKKLITDFLNLFISKLDVKIHLDKCFDKKGSREKETISELETFAILNKDKCALFEDVIKIIKNYKREE